MVDNSIILRTGSTGNHVVWLQQKLNILADGIFGSITERAVIEHQRKHGLVPDGIVGAKTYEKLGVKLKSDFWIALHVSASPENSTTHNADWVVYYHTKVLKWNKPGYHYIIERDGSIKETWKLDLSNGLQPSETTYGIGGWYDRAAINVCMIGGLDSAGRPKDTRTEAQKKSLEKLVKDLLKQAPNAQVVGHNQFWNKACPCFSVPKWAKSVGIGDENIENQDPFGYVRAYNG